MTLTEQDLTNLEYLHWLKHECGYDNPRPLPGDRWAATNQFLFTCAILMGRMGDRSGYEDRWCYHSAAEAKAALEAWNGMGEPTGWHRHPDSGRRRPDGNPSREYINP